MLCSEGLLSTNSIKNNILGVKVNSIITDLLVAYSLNLILCPKYTYFNFACVLFNRKLQRLSNVSSHKYSIYLIF